MRFPGGAPGEWFDWSCPFHGDSTPRCPATAESHSWTKSSPLDVWSYADSFGGTVLFQTNVEGNLPDPPGQSYAVNSSEHAAAWAAYARSVRVPSLMVVEMRGAPSSCAASWHRLIECPTAPHCGASVCTPGRLAGMSSGSVRAEGGHTNVQFRTPAVTNDL